MLEITKTTTIPVLRKYAEENNIDLGGATKRNDIIKAIQDAEAGKAPPSENTITRTLQASRLLMEGDDVAAVHARLEEKGISVGTDKASGIYGGRTAYAVRVFQARNRLIVDGKVGNYTATALGFEWKG